MQITTFVVGMNRPRGCDLEEIQRWVGFALKRGDEFFGIDLDCGWADLGQLASALAMDRTEFRNVTWQKLKMVLQDHSFRWEVKDDMVRKVPRSERGQKLVWQPQQPSVPPPLHLLRRPQQPQQPATVPPGHSWRSFCTAAADDENAKQVVKMEPDAQYFVKMARRSEW